MNSLTAAKGVKNGALVAMMPFLVCTTGKIDLFCGLGMLIATDFNCQDSTKMCDRHRISRQGDGRDPTPHRYSIYHRFPREIDTCAAMFKVVRG